MYSEFVLNDNNLTAGGDEEIQAQISSEVGKTTIPIKIEDYEKQEFTNKAYQYVGLNTEEKIDKVLKETNILSVLENEGDEDTIMGLPVKQIKEYLGTLK